LRIGAARGAYPAVMEQVARRDGAPVVELLVPEEPPAISAPAAAVLLRILRRAAAGSDAVPQRRAG